MMMTDTVNHHPLIIKALNDLQSGPPYILGGEIIAPTKGALRRGNEILNFLEAQNILPNTVWFDVGNYLDLRMMWYGMTSFEIKHTEYIAFRQEMNIRVYGGGVGYIRQIVKDKKSFSHNILMTSIPDGELGLLTIQKAYEENFIVPCIDVFLEEEE